MPRGPRLDAPGALHHVMARGIEGTRIFETDKDREDFVRRLAGQVEATGMQVLAWALLPNHLHLLLRTGREPLARVMRRVLTGYAGTFNRRHQRSGHLFQNRYKSIVVEEEPYMLELTRYIHLNPLRAGLVKDLAALDHYLWGGHSAVLGRVPRPWQAVHQILEQFDATPRMARRRYRAFVAEGVRQGRRPDLVGGGLRRSAGGWESLTPLRRGRERWSFDERVLGSGTFVERILRETEAQSRPSPGPKGRKALPLVIERVANAFGVRASEITQGNRRRPVAHARAAISALAVRSLGLPAAHVAPAIGVTLMAVLRGVERGAEYIRQHRLDSDGVVREVLRKV